MKNIIKRYKKDDVFSLEDQKLGKLHESLNLVFYANVVEIRTKTGLGACRIENYFKQKGFSVSHNKINQVIQYECLTR